jgi:ADP-ribose pyrophosphatase
VRIPAAPQKILAHGRYLELVDEGGWEYVRRTAASGVVVIVATTDDGALLLVEQPRVAIHRRAIELPAGLVGDHAGSEQEPFERAAERELLEETGFHAARWRRVMDGPASVGASAEVITFFRATGLTRVGPGGGDDSEDILVHLVPLADVPAFLAEKAAAGAAIDPKIFAGLYFIDGAWPPGPWPQGAGSPPR